MNKEDEVTFIDNDAPLDNIQINMEDDDDNGGDPLGVARESRESDGDSESRAETERLRQELNRAQSERDAALREKDAEIEKERMARLNSDETSVTFAVRAISQEIDGLSEKLIRAKEDGNTADEVRIQREITEKSGELSQAKVVLDNLKNAKEKGFKKETTQTKQEESKEAPQAAKDWIAQNQWYSDAGSNKSKNPMDYAKKSKAEQIYHNIANEGKLSVDQKEFYVELNRRLSKSMSEIEGGNSKNNNRSPVTKVSNGGGSDIIVNKGSGKLQVTLNRADKETMLKLKMNPNDPKMQKLFALEKVGVEAHGDDNSIPKPLNLDIYRRAAGQKPRTE